MDSTKERRLVELLESDRLKTVGLARAAPTRLHHIDSLFLTQPVRAPLSSSTTTMANFGNSFNASHDGSGSLHQDTLELQNKTVVASQVAHHGVELTTTKPCAAYPVDSDQSRKGIDEQAKLSRSSDEAPRRTWLRRETQLSWSMQ